MTALHEDALFLEQGAEITWGIAPLGLEYPVEIREVVETAVIADFRCAERGVGGGDKQTGSIS